MKDESLFTVVIIRVCVVIIWIIQEISLLSSSSCSARCTLSDWWVILLISCCRIILVICVLCLLWISIRIRGITVLLKLIIPIFNFKNERNYLISSLIWIICNLTIWIVRILRWRVYLLILLICWGWCLRCTYGIIIHWVIIKLNKKQQKHELKMPHKI